MAEICKVCGREKVEGGGIWNPSKCDPDMDAEHWRKGYEREKARADAAEALAEKWARIEGATVNRGIRADADALSEIQGLQEALAAARRECDEQREAKEAAYDRIYKALATLDAADLWSTRVINARAALAAPGDGEEGKR